MTDEQKQKALALGRCTFPVASSQKRFANQMLSYARNKPDSELTEKQVKYLHDLFHSYRRQIPNSHKKLCDCAEAQAFRAQMELK